MSRFAGSVLGTETGHRPRKWITSNRTVETGQCSWIVAIFRAFAIPATVARRWLKCGKSEMLCVPAGGDDRRNAWAHGRAGRAGAALPCTPPPRSKKVRAEWRKTAGRPSRENFSPPGFSGVSGVSDSDTPHRERGSIWFGWNAACEVPASIAPHTQAGAAGSARCGHPATELAGIPRSLAVTPRPTTLVSITHQPRLS